MKIVACSDAHTDARCCGVERFDEVVEAFGQASMRAHGERLDEEGVESSAVLFVFCGDLCDGEDGRDVLRASSLAIGMAREHEEQRVEQAWVCGNHDVLGDGTTTLDPLDAMFRAGSPYSRAATREPVHFEVPIASKMGADMVQIALLPYSPAPYDVESWLKRFLDETKTAVRRLVFSHLMLPGMHPGSESVEMARGKDRMFPVELLKGQKRLTVVQGHYHAGQTLKFHGVDVHVVGSMALNTFGEEGNVPSYLVMDVQRDGAKVERVPFTNSRKMVTIRRTLDVNQQSLERAFVRIDLGPGDEPLRMIDLAKREGAMAVKVVSAPRAEVVLDAKKSERSDLPRRSAREVVMGMVEEARSQDQAGLRTFVEEVSDEAGL